MEVDSLTITTINIFHPINLRVQLPPSTPNNNKHTEKEKKVRPVEMP